MSKRLYSRYTGGWSTHAQNCAMQHGGALLSLDNLAWLLEAIWLYDHVCDFTSAKILSFMFGLVMLNSVRRVKCCLANERKKTPKH